MNLSKARKHEIIIFSPLIGRNIPQILDRKIVDSVSCQMGCRNHREAVETWHVE